MDIVQKLSVLVKCYMIKLTQKEDPALLFG